MCWIYNELHFCIVVGLCWVIYFDVLMCVVFSICWICVECWDRCLMLSVVCLIHVLELCWFVCALLLICVDCLFVMCWFVWRLNFVGFMLSSLCVFWIRCWFDVCLVCLAYVFDWFWMLFVLIVLLWVVLWLVGLWCIFNCVAFCRDV